MSQTPLTELYDRVSKSCCCITVFLGDERISVGTGFSFAPGCQIMTAAHVITGRFPIRREDCADPTLRIYAKFPGVPVFECHVFLCGIPIEIPKLKAPIQIDQGILMPKTALAFEPPRLLASAAPPALGQEVFMAGFSDELALPFAVERLLPTDFKGVPEFFQAMEKGYIADMTGPLIKRGTIGNVRRLVVPVRSNAFTLECDVFYVDNSMHSGGSGGPVFDAQGTVLGLMTERATTEVDAEKGKLKVPSGATVGLSLQPLYLAIQQYAKDHDPRNASGR